MNPKHFHTPISTRVRCPVCHEVVYSRAGIHPQCAVRQADPPKPKGKASVVPGPAQQKATDPPEAAVVDQETLEHIPASDRPSA